MLILQNPSQSFATNISALCCTAAQNLSQAGSHRTIALAHSQAIVHQSILCQPYVTSGYHLCSFTKPHLKGILFTYQCAEG